MDETFIKEALKKSAYDHMGESDQTKGLPQPPLEMPFDGEIIVLPDPSSVVVPAMDLKEAIMKRVSIRKYKDLELPLDWLSYVLFHTQGIKKTFPTATLRTVPSAGARHAFETYLLVNHVEGLQAGLYRYIASKHALGIVSIKEGLQHQFVEATLFQHMIASAQVTFYWVADVKRMSYRYQERSLRYLFLDAGHVCQNLYLLATQLGMGTCGIAAFHDTLLNQALGIDGENQFAVYAGTLGFQTTT